MESREIQANGLCVIPLEVLPIEFTHSPINSNIKEEPLSPQYSGETDTDSRLCTDYFKSKESEDEGIIDIKVQRDSKSIDNGSKDEGEINNQSHNTVNVKTERLTGSGDVKQEKPEDDETNVEDSEEYNNIVIWRDVKSIKIERVTEQEELVEAADDVTTGSGAVKQEKPEEEEETHVRQCTGYIKFEDAEEYQNVVMWRNVQNIENEQVTGGKEIKHEVLVEAAYTKNMEAAGAARAEICKRIHARKIQDGKLTPGGKNIVGKRRTCTIVTDDEATSRNIYVLHGADKIANNEQLLFNTCMNSDTAKSKSVVSVNSDNDCTGTNTDGGNSSMKHLKRMFIDNDSDNVFDVNEHIETHSRLKLVECYICQRRFIGKWHLNRHLQTHTGIKPFECEICKVKFNQMPYLKKHLKVHIKEKPFECEVCKARFHLKCDLNAHLRIHSKEKPYECEICKVRFCRNSNLERHLRSHSNEKPYECEICKVRFCQNSNLKRHLRVHSDEKPYECEICKVRFSRNSHLKTHLRVHTKEKPYECDICKVRFTQKSSLNIHLRVHTKEKPYECEICKVRFSVSSSLKTHIRVHTKEKPYECGICKTRFSQRSHLNTHLKIHTKDQTF